MEGNPQLADVQVKIISSKLAKAYTLKNHYMKTFPIAKVCFGVIYKGKLAGVLTFGYSTATAEKVKALVPNIQEGEFIEMQRMHLLDILGKNAESYVLGEVYRLFKANTQVKVILTHAGGCKHDCGIVYQSSAWLYFGKSPCDDFFLTEAGEYKNIIAPMRFGRVPKGLKGGQEVGEYLFGAGKLINSYRYLYLYPIQKGMRKYLEKKALPYPKDSEQFRKDQKWQ